MLTRALIVVLALLNVSVALWWLLRGDPAADPPAQPAGVAELQFLGAGHAGAGIASDTALTDASPAPAPAAPPVAATPAPPPPSAPPVSKPAALPAAAPTADDAAAATPSPARCVAFGPFDDRAAATAAQQRLGAALAPARVQSQVAPAANARYRVMLPPAASREEAQATVARIQAAGLSDYYIIAQGAEANAIALGQYRNREGAERRLAALQAAGFQARLSGGEETTRWWLQGQVAGTDSNEQLRHRAGAARQQSLDCTTVR